MCDQMYLSEWMCEVNCVCLIVKSKLNSDLLNPQNVSVCTMTVILVGSNTVDLKPMHHFEEILEGQKQI